VIFMPLACMLMILTYSTDFVIDSLVRYTFENGSLTWYAVFVLVLTRLALIDFLSALLSYQ